MSILSASERAKIGIEGALEKHKSKRCWLFHSWGIWETTEQGGLAYANDPNRQIGRFMHQKRICACCGKVDLHTVQTSI